MTKIDIVENIELPPLSARIHKKTWEAVEAERGDSAFFQSGTVISVGANPFDPDYVLKVVDEEIREHTLFVSSDVKSKVYKDLDFLTY